MAKINWFKSFLVSDFPDLFFRVFGPIFVAALLFRAPVISPQKPRRPSVAEAGGRELGAERDRVRVGAGGSELTAGGEGWEL